MPILYLIRHAKPAATWGEAVDPGLDSEGMIQARERASELCARLAPLQLYTSPLRRCRETAQPLAERWSSTPEIFPAVAEIPSPPLSAAERRIWLTAGMQGTWQQLQTSSPPGSPDYLAWREALVAALMNLPNDSVIFTHYVAINVAVGAAQGHDRVLSFRPGHASLTTLEVSGARIIVRELGAETESGVVLLGK